MFSANGVYKHIAAKDMHLYVTKVFEHKTYYKLRVYYVNPRNGDLYVPTPQDVLVKKKDEWKWSEV